MNICSKDKISCSGCGACANVCTHDAIHMNSDEYGFFYPLVDETKCINCNLCISVCEKTNKLEKSIPRRAFAAAHLNKDVLKKSSSGGVFSALADHFLKIGGAVSGCIFDDNLNAIHICTEIEGEFLKIRKSKYLQSNVGLVYRDIKKRLKNGQKILFSGTPCQVAALYAFLGRRHENLTTMDLICHGVPSQLMFNRFISYLEKRYKTKIVDFNFRSKKYGWQRFSMEFTDSNNKKTNIGKRREFYMPAFTGGDIIRPSCLVCKYATPERVGDITIGDLWGYQNFNLKFDTVKGTSLFTVNTQNGEKWLTVLLENLTYEEIDYNKAVKSNHCLHIPTQKGKNRDFYMEALKEDKIEEIVTKYKKENKKIIIKERIKFLIPSSLFVFLKKSKMK